MSGTGSAPGGSAAPPPRSSRNPTGTGMPRTTNRHQRKGLRPGRAAGLRRPGRPRGRTGPGLGAQRRRRRLPGRHRVQDRLRLGLGDSIPAHLRCPEHNTKNPLPRTGWPRAEITSDALSPNPSEATALPEWCPLGWPTPLVRLPAREEYVGERFAGRNRRDSLSGPPLWWKALVQWPFLAAVDTAEP
jgi:hypothetical protein